MITIFNFEGNGGSMPLLDNPYFVLTEITGLTTLKNELASVTVPFMDGDIINSAQAMPRSVVLYLRLRESAGIEAAKRYVMNYVKPKRTGTLHLRQDNRETELSGTVEAVDLPRFRQGCTMAITLHCSQPYWTDVDYVVTEISNLLDLHYFPPGGLAFPVGGIPFGAYDTSKTRQLPNAGDVETGMYISIVALGTVVNPKLTNTATGEYIGVNITLAADDSLIINTLRGQKDIMRNGTTVIDKIMSGSTFLQLDLGKNEFYLTADSGADDMYFAISYKQLYV